MSQKIKEIRLSSDSKKLFEESLELEHFSHGAVGIVEAASLMQAKYAILVKPDKDEDGFLLLHQGDDLKQAKVAFAELRPVLSILLSLDNIEITVDLLNVLLRKQRQRQQQQHPAIKTEEDLIARIMEEIDSSPKNLTLLYPILEELKASTAIEQLNLAMNGSSKNDDDDDDDPSFFKEMTSAAGELFDKFMSKLEKIGTGIDDDELGDEIWKSFFSQIQDTMVPSLQEAETRVTNAFKTDSNVSSHSLIACVEKGYISTALQLLLFGEDPNKYDDSIGTALHVAVKTKSELMVKLLLAFNASPTVANSDNVTPIDLAEKDSEIHQYLVEAASNHKITNEYFKSHSELLSEEIQGTYLMSLDGGGIRAFNGCQYLIALEDRMKQLSPNSSSISSYFDYVAGTSSGAIAGLVLLYTDHTVRTGRYLVYDVIEHVFDKGLKDRKKHMNSYLKGIFKDTKMASLKRPQHAIVTATLANQHPIKLHLMTSYERRVMDEIDKQEAGPKDLEVWKAARITSAAPIHFPAVDDKFLDGGLMANNPTLAAMTEVIEQSEKRIEFGCVLSIGAGYPQKSKDVNNVNLFLPGVSFKSLIKLPKAVKSLFSVFDHFIEEVTQSNGHCIQIARSWCQNSGWNYYRWSPPLCGESEDVDPDCTDRAIIIDMMYHTQMDILADPKKVDDIAKCILAKSK